MVGSLACWLMAIFEEAKELEKTELFIFSFNG